MTLRDEHTRPWRSRQLTALLGNRPARFLLVGLLNTGFGFLAYSAAVLAGFSVPLALGLSIIAGVCFNFLTTGGWVFRDLSPRKFLFFVFAYSLVYVVNLVLLGLVRPWFASAILSQLLVVLPMAGFSYWLLSNFVFDTGSAAGRTGE